MTHPTLSPEELEEIAASFSPTLRLAFSLQWALNRLDDYDAILVRLGLPEDKVRSAIWLRGKELARLQIEATCSPEELALIAKVTL